VYQRPNLLLLDEPTNHLDLEMRQALATALQAFSGAMVIVSHDRHLLRVTCDQLLLVHDQRVDEFPLSLDEYPKWLSDQNKEMQKTDGTAATTQNTNNAAAKKDRKRLEAELRKKCQPLSRKVKNAEAELDKLHADQTELEQQLADPDIYTEANKQKLQDCLLKKADIDKRCADAEELWLEASEALEELNNSL
ncbi:MAG: ABC transporter ATP-binding protein, partial [Gammaproteobacteria bacterium]|nr:ABC transporter ATP-binding protein [Gammaproteobacteria bacterium]